MLAAVVACRRATQQSDSRWVGMVVIGFGVVKRKIRWRFQVGCDVVPKRFVCDGGRDGEWSGAEGCEDRWRDGGR